MNFFKLYIGDYQRDTAHLSIAEHGAYMLMLQHYYATESPLPTGKALHRMLRAQDKTERDAIDSIVSKFWNETSDGLVNERADAEITKAAAQADTNRTIALQREALRKAKREQHEGSTNRATNDQPNHSHTPEKREETPPTPRKRGSVCGFPPGFDRFWSAYPRKIGKDKAAQAFAKRKPDAEMIEVMLGAIEVQKLSEQWRKDKGQFIPHPSTWINGGRWMDEVDGTSDVPDELAEMFRRGEQ